MAEEQQEIHIAMFGQSGAGKTSLLASMIGNMGSDAFMQANGYKFDVHNASDTNANLARFEKMERGEFPVGTAVFHNYRFDFRLKGLEEPSFGVVLYDYPGGWWERDAVEAAEQSYREEGRQALALAHVAVLFIDGQALRERGTDYIHELLTQFTRFLQSFKQADTALTRSWILAVSKADTLKVDGALPNIYDLWSTLHQAHGQELEQLGRTLGAADDKRGSVSWSLLYLSAVDAPEGLIKDAHAMLGADLIVPLAFRRLLDIQRAELHQSSVKQAVSTALGAIPTTAKFAKKFPPLKLISALGGLDIISSVAGAGQRYFDEQRAALDERRDKTDRAAAMMRALLLKPASRALYAEGGNPLKQPPAPHVRYTIDTKAVLWRTRGLHFDYEFFCKPDLVEAYGGWFEVWRKIFGGREPRTSAVNLLGSLNGTPYLASIFQDAQRLDVHGRPIVHFVMWLMLDPQEHNPFEQLQVPADWGAQLVDVMAELPEASGLLQREVAASHLPELLKDCDVAIDSMAPVTVSGPLVAAEILPFLDFKALQLPSRANWANVRDQAPHSQFLRDIEDALLEGDMFAMMRHLGLAGGALLPTPRIRADQLRAAFTGRSIFASLRRQLLLSYQAGEADHFVTMRLDGIHGRLSSWSSWTSSDPRPGFDALLSALRRHKKDVVLASLADRIDQRALLAGWIDEALITDGLVSNLLEALVPQATMAQR